MALVGFLGIVVFGFGLYVRMGGFKVWYLTKGVPFLMPIAVQHMMMPAGITLVGWSLFTQFISDKEARLSAFNIFTFTMLFLSVLLGIWQPRWLRPQWHVYLEDEYGSAMWRLLEEARKNAGIWEQRVRTQKGLEEWAEETRIRLGYPPHPGQIEREAKKRREPPA